MDQASTDSPDQIDQDQVEEDEDIGLINHDHEVDQEITTTEYLCLIKNLRSYDPTADPTRYPKEPIPIIKKIWEAFMNIEDITDKRLASGKQCQAATRITTGYYPNFAIESACWDILVNCYDCAFQGRLVLPHHCLKVDDSLTTVEDRLEAVIYTLRVNKAICKMLLDPAFIHRLIDNPYRELKSKENNNRINGIRDQQNHIGRAAIKRGVDDKEKIQGILAGVLGPDIPEPKIEKAQPKPAKPRKVVGTSRGKKAAGTRKASSIKRKRTSRGKKYEEDDDEEDDNDSSYAEFGNNFDNINRPMRPKRSRSDVGQKSYVEIESEIDSPTSDFQPLPKTPGKKGNVAGYSNAHYSSPNPITSTPRSVYDLLSSIEPASPSNSRVYPAQPTPEGFAGSASDIFSSPAGEPFYPVNDFTSSVSRRLFSSQPSPLSNSFLGPFSNLASSPMNEYSPFNDQESSLGQGSISNIQLNFEIQTSPLGRTVSETGNYSPSVQSSTLATYAAPTSSLSKENLALLAMFQKGSQQDAQDAHIKSSPDEIKTTWEFRGPPSNLSNHQLEFQYRGQICAVLGVSPDLLTDTILDHLRTYAHAYNEQFSGLSWTPAFSRSTIATGPIVSTDEGLVHLSVVEPVYLKLALARGDIDEDGNMIDNPSAKSFSVNQSDTLLQEALGMVPNRFGIHYAVREAVEEMESNWLREGMEDRMKERHGEQLGAQLAAEMRFGF